MAITVVVEAKATADAAGIAAAGIAVTIDLPAGDEVNREFHL